MPSPNPLLRRPLPGLWLLLGLFWGLAVLSPPAAAQEASAGRGGITPPGVLASRFAAPWQGTWVSPDGHAWTGNWPGDLLTPDGRAVGAEEFEHLKGTAFLVIHPRAARDGEDWTAVWVEECRGRLRDGGFGDGGVRVDSCGGWLRYYRRLGLIYPDYGYAVPVNLLLSRRAGCSCRTVTVTEYAAHRAGARHGSRAGTRRVSLSGLRAEVSGDSIEPGPLTAPRPPWPRGPVRR